jgi:hypothetical protein
MSVVQISLAASDDTSGIDAIHYRLNGGAWQTYSGTFTVGDGTHTVAYRSTDVTGNQSEAQSLAVSVDTTPPASAINPLLAYQSTPTFTISWSGSDAGVGLDSFDVQFRDGIGETWTDWLTYTTQTSATFGGADGHAYYFQSRARDVLGNTESYPGGNGDARTLVDVTAPTGTVQIDGGMTYALMPTVTLSLAAWDTTSGISGTQYSNDGANFTAWEAYATLKGWMLESGDGFKTVYVRFRDAAGNVSAVYSDTIVLDTTSPTDTIQINGGAIYTPIPTVTLTLDAHDINGVAAMRFSNDGVTFTAWLPYSATHIWRLADGDGTRVVYVLYRDTAGNVSPSYFDTIILDTTPPETSATPSGTVGNNGWWRSAVAVALAASDTVAGIDHTTYRVDAAAWQTYTIPFTVSVDGAHNVEYASVDTVGNREVTRSLELRIDTTPPSTTAILTGTLSGTDWYISAVKVGLSASDDTSGVDVTRYRLNSGAWQTYSTTFVVTDGVHTLECQSTDRAGNQDALQSHIVRVDTTPPTATVDLLTPYQTALTFTVSWSGTDALSGIASFDVQARDGDQPWTDWLTATTALSATFEGLDGHTFYFRARARDVLGNLGSYAPGNGDTATHVDTTRPEGDIAINDGAIDTTSRDVQLVLLANGASQAAFSNDGMSCSAWEPFPSTYQVRAHQLPAGDGVKTVYVCYVDFYGSVVVYSDTINLNTSIPGDVGLSINDDAPTTEQITVTLVLKSPPGTHDMLISNSSRFVAAEWEPYAVTRTWVLAYHPNVTVYQVYARFRSVDGTLSERYDDIITLHLVNPPPPIDSIPPSGSLSINAGAESTSVPTVTLDVLAADNPGGVGVRWMYFREWKYDPVVVQWVTVRSSDWLPHTENSTAWMLAPGTGVKYVGAWFADGANNVSNPAVLDSINLVLPGDTITQSQVTQYRRTFEPGQTVTATLVVTSGDADLYIWRPGSTAAPDYWSNQPGTATERLVFTAVEGEYLIEVHGYASSQYTLDIATSGAGGGAVQQSVASVQMADAFAPSASKPVPSHPLVSTRPGGAPPSEQPKHHIYLPLIIKNH